MQEPQAPTPFALKDSFGPGGNFLLALARLMAIIGGLIFVGLVDDAWYKEAATKGANGKALYDEAVALLKKYDK